MAKYLGQKVVDHSNVDFFKNFGRIEWAMYFIERYSQIDGSHHKTWVTDQVARILKGTPVIVSLATWDDGEEEYRVSVSENLSDEYISWRNEMRGEYDEEFDDYEYGYDEGIAP